MSYNGSGTFQINSTGQPVVTGTVISSTAFNALTADLATGLSTAITKDGQTTPTANIKLGGFKLTNVGTATTAGDALIFGSGTNSSTLAVPTRQVLTSGTTYTTPANVRQLKIRMVGGGGGGGGASTSTVVAGSDGTASSFNSINAAGGKGALGGAPGYSATAGTGTASYRSIGNAGHPGVGNGGVVTVFSGIGGGSVFGAATAPAGGGTIAGVNAQANTGAGGSGGSNGGGATGNAGGGGQAGEYVEIIINSPSATYTYTIGASGAGGSSTNSGGAGGSGVIIVDEIY